MDRVNKSNLNNKNACLVRFRLELKKEFIAAFKENGMEEFLKSQNCSAAPADVMAFLNGTKEEIVSEDDLAKVAGGCGSSATCGDYCTIFCA